MLPLESWEDWIWKPQFLKNCLCFLKGQLVLFKFLAMCFDRNRIMDVPLVFFNVLEVDPSMITFPNLLSASWSCLSSLSPSPVLQKLSSFLVKEPFYVHLSPNYHLTFTITMIMMILLTPELVLYVCDKIKDINRNLRTHLTTFT